MKKLYLLHGSLGAGKTTLLNKMLSNSYFRNSVVIENEFANFSIDDYLISKNEEANVTNTIAGGCICCTSGQEFVNTLDRLVTLPNVDKIIIESTGVANSIEIIKQLILSENYEKKFEFGANIMLVDVLEDEVNKLILNKVKEIKLSDLVLVTKSDITDIKKVNKLISNIGRINPNIEKSVKGSFDNSKFFTDDFKSDVSNKIRNNIDEYLLNETSDTVSDSYYVLKVEGKIFDLKIKSFVNELVKSDQFNIKRVKGFYLNSNNESVIVNGTKNNIEYLKSKDMFGENTIVIIGTNIDSKKIENIKSKILDTYE